MACTIYFEYGMMANGGYLFSVNIYKATAFEEVSQSSKMKLFCKRRTKNSSFMDCLGQDNDECLNSRRELAAYMALGSTCLLDCTILLDRTVTHWHAHTRHEWLWNI
jgi:hypothetical protein